MSNATPEAVVASPSVITCDASPRRCIPLAALRQIPEVEILVDGFVASWHPRFASIQSGRWHRIPFDKPLIISPLDDSSELCSGFSFAVQGQDISLVGVSFTHREPLTSRKVAVTFPFEDGESAAVVTLLRWCRFKREGLYQSGGRFLRSVALADERLGTR
jgi:hypothetical protein